MTAYYYRNSGNEYSRSYNAARAEVAGLLPKTRAARRLGVSVEAFDAGCAEAGYYATEWHHVGKYANRVDYYDTEALAPDSAFWRGVLTVVKSKSKRAEIESKMTACLDFEKAKRIADFKSTLEARRNCSRFVPSGANKTAWNWAEFCLKFLQISEFESCKSILRKGDFEFLAAEKVVIEEKRSQLQWKSMCNDHSSRCDGIYRAEYGHFIAEKSKEIVPLVPMNHPGCSFRTIYSAAILATAVTGLFRNTMESAKLLAAEMGFNAVVPVNPNNSKYGNGWIPAMAVL